LYKRKNPRNQQRLESISLSLSKSSKVLTEGLHFEKLQLIDFPVAVQDYHAGCVQFAPDLSLLSSPLVRVSLFSFLFFFLLTALLCPFAALFMRLTSVKT
jgi:hypothetical protein